MPVILSAIACGTDSPTANDAGTEPTSTPACEEMYVDPTLAPFDNGVVVPHLEYTACVTGEPPSAWCETWLPCWDGHEDCPLFDEFLQVIGWLDDDPAFAFTTGTAQATYLDYTVVLACPDYDIFVLRSDNLGGFLLYFAVATGRLEFISAGASGPGGRFECAADSTEYAWWGEPVDSQGECELHTRSHYLYLVEDTAAPVDDRDTGERDERGCGCVVTPGPAAVPIVPMVLVLLRHGRWPRLRVPRTGASPPRPCPRARSPR